jgi:hypothetical protein
MIRPAPFLLIGCLLTSAAPASADRPPNPRERAAIETVLRGQGFVSWEEIALDDDGPLWEVDDARGPDGRRFDLKLDPRTMRIVRRERDH